MPGYRYDGQKAVIFTWADGIEAWDELFAKYGKQYGQHLSNMIKRLERLGDFGQLPPDQLHHQQDGVYAVKSRSKFRVYGWFESLNGKKCFVIGQAAFKKEDKADPTKIKRCIQLMNDYKRQNGESK
ncbi:hypothetical protein [Arenimonas caeni]|uniref:Addiction module toxin RelE n=1 Tax=Arenimonas caeni TaxID=2058085 RepID=A0A2P6M7K4_9GAMM|nr:hypothetical protein [Arenimonas caeni]PRH81979.1 hypothetical protein C6N40_09240 [Arenimonas caeni]